MHSIVMAGSNFTLHAAGWLGGGLAAGFEKLVMDADRLGAYAKLLCGLDLNEDALARDAYAQVPPAGHFLGSSHTMRRYQTAFHESALSDSENVENWEDGGSKTMEQRAFERWNHLLKTYEAPPIDEAAEAYAAFLGPSKRSCAMASAIMLVGVPVALARLKMVPSVPGIRATFAQTLSAS